jgi:pimeloyl-ACP methyl ester carboxylesterase
VNLKLKTVSLLVVVFLFSLAQGPIELAFVRLKSTAEKPGYPVVYPDGGPGSSAINIARVPDYMRAFMKLRETGDVILLDQRGIGRSKPNLSRLATENLPLDSFATCPAGDGRLLARR